MAAAYLEPKNLDQGATYEEALTIKDSTGVEIDFTTGYTALFEIRAGSVDGGAEALVTLTDEDGIVLGTGLVTVTVSSAKTAEAVSSTSASKLYAELDITEASSGDTNSYRWQLHVNREYARAEA